jgi:hypothetical protein
LKRNLNIYAYSIPFSATRGWPYSHKYHLVTGNKIASEYSPAASSWVVDNKHLAHKGLEYVLKSKSGFLKN